MPIQNISNAKGERMRIGETNIVDTKQIGFGLTAIFGIGRSSSVRICHSCGISPNVKAGDLGDLDVSRLKIEISRHLTEGDLRRYILANVRRLISINCYRGTRHRKNLPSRGQRTRTNARTRRKVVLPIKSKTSNEKRQK